MDFVPTEGTLTLSDGAAFREASSEGESRPERLRRGGLQPPRSHRLGDSGARSVVRSAHAIPSGIACSVRSGASARCPGLPRKWNAVRASHRVRDTGSPANALQGAPRPTPSRRSRRDQGRPYGRSRARIERSSACPCIVQRLQKSTGLAEARRSADAPGRARVAESLVRGPLERGGRHEKAQGRSQARRPSRAWDPGRSRAPERSPLGEDPWSTEGASGRFHRATFTRARHGSVLALRQRPRQRELAWSSAKRDRGARGGRRPRSWEDNARDTDAVTYQSEAADVEGGLPAPRDAKALRPWAPTKHGYSYEAASRQKSVRCIFAT
jgi:hypothetical protein